MLGTPEECLPLLRHAVLLHQGILPLRGWLVEYRAGLLAILM